MISKWIVLLVCFYGVVSQNVRHPRDGLSDTSSNEHTLKNMSPSSSAVNSHYSTTPQPIQYQRSTLQSPYYCRASNPKYDCILRRVIVESRQSVYFGWMSQHRQVTFEDSRMQFLPKALIDALSGLELLNVASLQIETIADNAFQNARNLDQLYMEDNLISSIKRDTFRGANYLTTLALGKNRIDKFEPNALKELTSLRHLYVDSNRMTNIPLLDNNVYLEVLKASHNNIKMIANYAFCNNSYLYELDLAFNELRSFNTTQLNDMESLKLVDVSSNQLTHLIIPNTIRTLRANNNSISRIEPYQRCRLLDLELGSNQLKTMHGLRYCFELQNLDLSYNQLVDLNPEQLAMTPLVSLNLTHNHLFEILSPPQISRSFLRMLDLSHNSLSVWPNNFQFWYAVELALSSNEWQCIGLQSVTNQNITDREVEKCQPDSKYNNGICCSEDSSNVQILSKLAKRIRGNESQDKEWLKERCLSSKSYHPSVNNEHLSNLREQVALTQSSMRDILQVISSVGNQLDEKESRLQKARRQNHETESKTVSLTRNIRHFVDTYGVPREGLGTPQEMLETLLTFVLDRNRNNTALLSRRVQEKQENDELLAAQQNELKSTKLAQDTYKTMLGNLEMEEMDAKTVRDILRNANEDDMQNHFRIVQLNQDNALHENQFRERLREHCLIKNYNQLKRNGDRYSSIIAEASKTESSKGQVLLSIDELQNQIKSIENDLIETRNKIGLITMETNFLTSEINHFIDTSTATNDGHATPAEMFSRVVAFVNNRNRKNVQLLRGRQRKGDQLKYRNALNLISKNNMTEELNANKASLRLLKRDEDRLQMEFEMLYAETRNSSVPFR